ncbi:MAG: hypothetical protein FWH29_01700 [Methanobrevibacter sp.]|nr:hypothetical protein [Methanobrevibacter sp.]
MNKKFIIILIGILAILSLSTGIYMASLYEPPTENITSNNDSKNNSNDNISEDTPKGKSQDTSPKQSNTGPNQKDNSPSQNDTSSGEDNDEYIPGACW